MTEQQTPPTDEKTTRTWTEEVEIVGNQLVERVQDLVAEGNVRRLIIRGTDDKTLLEIPLTFGAVAGGALVFAAPWLAALGAFAALVARVKIEIVREGPAE